VRRLERALIEQARLGDAYERAAGTSSEQSAYLRLRAASFDVTRCDRTVKTFEPPMGGGRRAAGDGTTRLRRRVSIALGNVFAFSVDGGPRAPAEARAELTDRLAPKLDPAIVQTAELLLSELVSNCVLHGAAATPGTWVDVSASIFPHAVLVEVSDGGHGFKYELDDGPLRLDDISGRGLCLVNGLSSRWGISKRGRARVWFELARTPAAHGQPSAAPAAMT
jgi:anti-sigma regulatory factor (Ser/Thr protein kinase)